MSACPDPTSSLGVIRSVLGTVDCHVRTYSEAGYLALTGPNSFFPAALTALLTIYVALLGLRLMFGIGGARLADAPVMALKIGVILALTMSWTTFQTLVFDLTMRAPLQVARVVAAPAAGGSGLASNPLNGLQIAYDELALDAAAFGQSAGPDPQVLRGGEAAAAESLWKAQSALFMSTAGLMSIASIAVGVLAAVGPVFIALFLFRETRGLFAGWLRAIVAAALTPMMCWITTTVLLVTLEPWLAELAHGRQAGSLDLQTARTVSSVIFIFATAQAALAFGAGVIASGFQLNLTRPGRASAPASAPVMTAADPLSRAEKLALQMQPSAALRNLAFAGGSAGGTESDGSRGGGGRKRIASDASDSGSRTAVVAAYRRDAVFDRFRKTDRSH